MTTGLFEHTEDLVYGTLTVKEKQPFSKRVLIVDDDPDITLTFKEGIENSNGNEDLNKKLKYIHITSHQQHYQSSSQIFMIFY